MSAYYNEHEPYAAQWLRNLIAKGLIADGEVDTRSIIDVRPDELKGFTQCHFFAGIGGWSFAARLAGWPDDRPLWTGSAPCQPFSVAGKGAAQADERHLWPTFFDLIRARRPAVLFGEQVAAAIGKNWLDGVLTDLEREDYACEAFVLPACAVDAPHRRDRLWFVADCASTGLAQRDGAGAFAAGEPNAEPQRGGGLHGPLTDAGSGRRGGPGEGQDQFAWGAEAFWSDEGDWIIGADGKARRVEPSICLLAHGIPARVGRLRAYGNAIVPQVAAQVIAAYMDVQT